MIGIVLKSTGSWYLVRTKDGKVLQCRIRGVLKLQGSKATNPVAVGDKVEVEIEVEADAGEGKGVITDVKDRKNYIIRRSTNLSKQTHVLAANVDRMYILATVTNPRTSPGFIDRLLVTAEAYQIPATLLINKQDIYSEEDLEAARDWVELYGQIGYECILFSALNSKDVDALRKKMSGCTNLITGHSGTGKTTLINALEPGLGLKIGTISEAHSKGTHTTTFAEMHELSSAGGGWLIDTPGIKEFGIVNVEKTELSHFFPEIFRKSKECKFNGCLHLHEPKCAVVEAVENGEIALSRYETYLNILEGEELKTKWQ